MAFDAGDLVVVPFPFTDMKVSRTRPALVLSAQADNRRTGSCLLAMVTTATRSAWTRDTPLSDWQAYGLRGPCIVRTKLFTLDNRLIARRLASLSVGDRERVRAAMAGLIAL